ncbi:uncharacterized protein LOC122246419 [Penaeus japonicus]|uniref:uncharacterized protein LOC122246419 n=1 Tax=Penaeus japonicus TaxID=27405 RepID=UPI001C70FAE4|nr:uncharacterized protein LOC122246419 [Penaeus japonicus]
MAMTTPGVRDQKDKLNRFLCNIKDSVGDSVYNCLFASKSRPGVLYGLPKIHKAGNPIRPIISSIGTFNYNLVKFLVPLLTPLTKNDYTVENTMDFVKEITTVKINGPVVMASVDVQSLFTNIPHEEDTTLIVRKLTKSKDFQQLNEKQLTKALHLATADSVFNDDLYSETDGVAMGSPLAHQDSLASRDSGAPAIIETETEVHMMMNLERTPSPDVHFKIHRREQEPRISYLTNNLYLNNSLS